MAPKIHFVCFVAGAMLCGAAHAAGEGEHLAQLRATPPSSAPRALPSQGSDADCRSRWREYRRSQACFAPFLTVNGIKPEAFSVCGPEVRDPSPDCGPPPQR